jgi:hypothetical protein
MTQVKIKEGLQHLLRQSVEDFCASSDWILVVHPLRQKSHWHLSVVIVLSNEESDVTVCWQMFLFERQQPTIRLFVFADDN